MEDKEFETKEQSVVEEVVANKPKKNKSKIVIVFLLILIVLGISGYFIYTNCFENKDKKESKEVKPLVENTEFTNEHREYFYIHDNEKSNKEIDEIVNQEYNTYDQELVTKLKNKKLLNGELNDIDLEDCEYLLHQIQVLPGYYWDKKSDIYHVDKLLADDITEEYKYYIAAVSVTEKIGTYHHHDMSYLLKINNFKNHYYDLFRKNNINLENCIDNDYIHYSIKDSYIDISFSGGYSAWSFIDMPYKASVKDNELYIYELVAYTSSSPEPNNYSELYKDKEKTEVICSSNCESYYTKTTKSMRRYNDLSLDHADEFAQYKYTFKLKDNNYYFYSVERVD